MFRIIVCFSLVFITPSHAYGFDHTFKEEGHFVFLGSECNGTDTCVPVNRIMGHSVSGIMVLTKVAEGGQTGPSERCEGYGLSGFGRTRCCIKKTSLNHCILARGDAKGTCECLHKEAKLEYPKDTTTTRPTTTPMATPTTEGPPDSTTGGTNDKRKTEYYPHIGSGCYESQACRPDVLIEIPPVSMRKLKRRPAR